LVPQELATDMFTTVWDSVRFSRGLFGRTPNNGYLERILRDLSLWDKRGAPIRELSGGMKLRVLIAKALAHEPTILFLDEPTAGVDVELRRDMWAMVRRLREQGVTVILTTHYLEEAEEMADRIGVIDDGRIILVEEKNELMRTLGKTRLTIGLRRSLASIPDDLQPWPLILSADGLTLSWTRQAGDEDSGFSDLLKKLIALEIEITSISTERSSLEDIFVDLIKRPT
jgi:ABC-2 type transport system ATP-binding protein